VVDPLGVFTLMVAGFLVAGVFIGYYIFEDFTGIAFGVAMATAFSYIPRNLWLGLASKAVGGP
jgi:hypothetical protein